MVLVFERVSHLLDKHSTTANCVVNLFDDVRAQSNRRAETKRIEKFRPHGGGLLNELSLLTRTHRKRRTGPYETK